MVLCGRTDAAAEEGVAKVDNVAEILAGEEGAQVAARFRFVDAVQPVEKVLRLASHKVRSAHSGTSPP